MSNTLVLHDPSNPTMTSLEMVDYINRYRKETGDPVILRHGDFCEKVPLVLGAKTATEISAPIAYTVKGKERTRPGYVFPKREACLMAMSYSYELQAKVFDYMTELEVEVRTLQVNSRNLLARSEQIKARGIPSDFIQSLRLNADALELADGAIEYSVGLETAVQKKDALLLEAEPAILRNKQLEKSDSLMTIKQLADHLEVPEMDLRSFLKLQGIIFQHGGKGRWRANKKYTLLGYIRHGRPNVPGLVYCQAVRFTNAGVRWIEGMLEAARVEEQDRKAGPFTLDEFLLTQASPVTPAASIKELNAEALRERTPSKKTIYCLDPSKLRLQPEGVSLVAGVVNSEVTTASSGYHDVGKYGTYQGYFEDLLAGEIHAWAGGTDTVMVSPIEVTITLNKRGEKIDARWFQTPRISADEKKARAEANEAAFLAALDAPLN